MAFDYDTVVIGGGPGGLAVAYGLNASQKVLVIEGNLWGGTCPNFGCDPKKMLYGVVEAKRQVIRYQESGLPAAPNIDWSKMMAFKRGYTEKVPTGTESGLKRAGIDHLHGTAAFVDAHTLRVGDKQVSGKQIVIATGATPTIPDITGKDAFKTSTDFLNLAHLPQKIGFVGAGYVAIELANIAVEAGAEVHVFQHNDRVLRHFPQEYTERLKDILAKKGVHFHMNTNVIALNKEGSQVEAATDNGDSIKLNAIFAAAGRRPNLDQLNLTGIGVAVESQGVKVDDHLRTSIPSIYAIGDAVAKSVPKLTPVSGIEGRYVASLIAGETDVPIQYPAIPHTVFAGPELAQVGVTLEAATKDPDHYTISDQSVGSWYTYNRLRDKDAHVTTIVDKPSGKLVGAVVLAVNAEELINDFSELITHGTPAEEATDWTPIYPSVSSDLGYFY
ncbi:NAD(P)/FAD-dependent oxidoreductase [Lactobacillus sp. LC28-10]|uniref:NAD(P)/FAD-dependent oxidoreductase n=1 Tax=Secundilactobacillus angelensis TaxID=2722706 RepID=A0ABX1KUM3_9LACO|nr:NAD(P)/FAD-dependent oxidoreductase [Secundilactobacillus angelensis]MCH5461841.1 NAD(P)/FAD-dependent oxidoreductase [Secundilactobacillus angelensis]NLR17329.1 NAD(P)/FAD-dependent oxidoreductase [Secundilactobacillus angelensis]